MSYGIFFIIVLFFSLFLFLNIYIGKNLKLYLRIMGFRPKRSSAYWTVFILVSMSYLIARSLSKLLPMSLDVALTTIGAYYLAVMMYSLIAILGIRGLLFLLKKKGLKAKGKVRAVKLLGTAAIVSISILLVYGTYNAKNTKLKSYDIELDKRSFESELKIVFVSDIHLGSIIGNGRLERLVDEVNSLSPDIVLLGGDIVDEDVELFMEMEMIDKLEKIEARYGVYGVLGNHEYIGGSESEFEEILEGSSIEILKDEHVKVAGLALAGRDDLSGERFTGVERKSVKELLRGIDRENAIILMDHQPQRAGEAEDLGVDLILSGHTHRGQLFPASIITEIVYDEDWGIQNYGEMKAIISSGYGTWGPPVRVGSNSEIVILNIKFK